MSAACASERELPATGSSGTGSSEQVDPTTHFYSCIFVPFIVFSSPNSTSWMTHVGFWIKLHLQQNCSC
jgi:hypothetical protein